MMARRVGTRVLDFFAWLLAHRCLPVVLATAAALVMLPALTTGLVLDDLAERAVALPPSRLPPRMHETGNPADCGSFSTVLRDYFFNRDPKDMALARNYGMLPWWAPADLRINLWRPATALTHWLDYQLFPDQPALTHV